MVPGAGPSKLRASQEERLGLRAVLHGEEVVRAQLVLLGAAEAERRVVRRRAEQVRARVGGVEVASRGRPRAAARRRRARRRAGRCASGRRGRNGRVRRSARSRTGRRRAGRSSRRRGRRRSPAAGSYTLGLAKEVTVVARVRARSRRAAGTGRRRRRRSAARARRAACSRATKASIESSRSRCQSGSGRGERVGGLRPAHEELGHEPVVGDRGLVVAAVGANLMLHLRHELAGRPAAPSPALASLRRRARRRQAARRRRRGSGCREPRRPRDASG